MTTVLDTPEQIEKFRKLVIYRAVKMDAERGMKMSRMYRLSAVKAEFGLKGGKVKCLEQLDRILRLDGTLPSCPNHPGVAPADERVSTLCTECSAHGTLKVVP